MAIRKGHKFRIFLYWGCVLCCILLCIASMIMWPDGNNGWTYEVHMFERSIMPLFYSYKEAYLYAAGEYQYIILNICMFIPLGFVLPVGKAQFRKFWRTVFIAFILAFFMELGRCLVKQTAMDPDNLVNHIIGAMIGYGGYIIFEKITDKFRKESQTRYQNRSMRAVILHQIPLFVSTIVLVGIFAVHVNRELGNMAPYETIIPYESATISVSAEKDWSDANAELPVCQIKEYSEDEATIFAERLFEKIGEKMEKTSIRPSEGTYYMHFKTVEGSYFYLISHNGEYVFERYPGYVKEHPLETENGEPMIATEQEVRDALLELGIEVPIGAAFSTDEVAEEGLHYFRADMLEFEDCIYDGYLRCQYTADGNITQVNNSMHKFTVYKMFSGISESEAYNQISNGAFYWRNNHPKALPRKIQVKDCKISYFKSDSKNFYQPVYVFNCEINNQEDEIVIPCIQ